jgi:hypothetical protein
VRELGPGRGPVRELGPGRGPVRELGPGHGPDVAPRACMAMPRGLLRRFPVGDAPARLSTRKCAELGRTIRTAC